MAAVVEALKPPQSFDIAYPDATLVGGEALSIPQGQERLLGYLPVWRECRLRFGRSVGDNPNLPTYGKPLDGPLALEWKKTNAQMGQLLDEYLVFLGDTAVGEAALGIPPLKQTM
jgi:hypothetical protein